MHHVLLHGSGVPPRAAGGRLGNGRDPVELRRRAEVVRPAATDPSLLSPEGGLHMATRVGLLSARGS